ncbi:MAG: hypothetical protein HF307_18835 [Ignavibacteria bacterium]|nr:hypothetical protein [Ignavibacteria bacterium]
MKKEKLKKNPVTETELRQRLKELQKENEYLRTYLSICKTQLIFESSKPSVGKILP